MADKLLTSQCPSVSVADITECALSPAFYDSTLSEPIIQNAEVILHMVRLIKQRYSHVQK